MEKKLTRPQNDKVIAGVCSGLANYFSVETSLVRILAALGIVFTGLMPGVLIYGICWIVIPESAE